VVRLGFHGTRRRDALWHPSRALLFCPLIVAVSAQLFVVFYEEPHLRMSFGAEYEEYCRSVPRWLPHYS
jgi:protein-S-isoprenylcysteine O-methyltransferase Ste14